MKAAIIAMRALTLAACNAETPEAEQADGAELAQEAAAPAAVVEGAAAEAELAVEDTGTGIPQALQGRWGLVPADCEPGRDDAKGLLVIDGDGLEFYESMGTLDDVAQREAGSIRAAFSFSGEGMTWSREMELVTTDGGQTMTRREFGEEAMPGALEYARCA